MTASRAPVEDVEGASLLSVRRDFSPVSRSSFTYTSYKKASSTSSTPALATLRTARLAGLKLRHYEGELRLSADAEPAAELLDELRLHKAELIELLEGR